MGRRLKTTQGGKGTDGPPEPTYTAKNEPDKNRGLLNATTQSSSWLSWYRGVLDVADRLPGVVRFPAGPRVRLKAVDPPKGNGLGQKKKAPKLNDTLRRSQQEDYKGPMGTTGGVKGPSFFA